MVLICLHPEPLSTLSGQSQQSIPAEWRFIASPDKGPDLTYFELRLPASGYVFVGSAKLAASLPNLPLPPDRTDNPIMHMTEPPPEGDLKVTLELVKPHKFIVGDEPANTFFYGYRDLSQNVDLTLRDGQLSGNRWGTHPSGFMLSAQRQSP